MSTLVFALVGIVIVLECCVIMLLLRYNKRNGELERLKRRLHGLEIVVQHKFQCIESEQQAIAEKFEYHILNRDQN